MSDDSTRIAKSVAQKRGQRCRNFNGVQNDACKAGVCYAELQKQGTLMIPCLPRHVSNKPFAACDKYATYTPNELAEQEREINDHLVKMEKVMASIKQIRLDAKKSGQSWSGKIDCAACGGKTTLSLSITNYNWHARGRCSACDVGWIE